MDSYIKQQPLAPRFFVLTYIHNRPEYWLRTSAVEIVDCFQSWMTQNGDEDIIYFSIREFDKKKQITIIDDVYDWKLVTPEELLEEAVRVDYEYPSNAVMPEGEIKLCTWCCAFTMEDHCKLCGTETINVEH